MLPIDPGGDQDAHAVSPAQPVRDIVPPQAMAHGGTIIRPGAVAWGGMPDAADPGYSSCEAVERALAAAAKNLRELPGLLAELAATRVWVPLPARHRPFTDGAAVLLPVIGYEGIDFVPCFTSVQRLTAWTDREPGREGSRQRAGDARVSPHIVVPSVGLARLLPANIGLALNPDSVPGLPLYPESVTDLAGLVPPVAGPPAGRR
jgi:SseB protein N-terminal domain